MELGRCVRSSRRQKMNKAPPSSPRRPRGSRGSLRSVASRDKWRRTRVACVRRDATPVETTCRCRASHASAYVDSCFIALIIIAPAICGPPSRQRGNFLNCVLAIHNIFLSWLSAPRSKSKCSAEFLLKRNNFS